MISPLHNSQLNSTGLDGFLASKAEAVEQVRTPQNVVLNAVGYNLHTYPQKQCCLNPSMLVTAEKSLAYEVAA